MPLVRKEEVEERRRTFHYSVLGLSPLPPSSYPVPNLFFGGGEGECGGGRKSDAKSEGCQCTHGPGEGFFLGPLRDGDKELHVI